MKKVILTILILIGIIFSYFFLAYKKETVTDLLKNVENDKFDIDSYSIFGNHFSISGCIDKLIDNELKLVLKSKQEEMDIESNFYNDGNKTCFYLSKNNNDGLDLDYIKTGKYLLLVKENDTYYTLSNKTDYKDLEYYTITRNNSNNKVNISFDKYNDKDYIEFKIKKSNLPKDVYDIVIDPGHGGKDVGASGTLNGKTYYESKLTLKISLLLKQELESVGLKVKLTRDDDTYLEPYGKGGRALLPNYYKSKYSLSIHVNSSLGKMNYGGVEIYTPNDINLNLATLFSDNIADVVGYSKKATDKIAQGVYYTYFTKNDIEKSNNEMRDKGMKPYNIKEGSPYMYMIREVGGIHTHAYIDGRNEYYGLNEYYNSNITTEPYLLELAYINYTNDLKTLINNPDKFSKAIAKSLKNYLNIS